MRLSRAWFSFLQYVGVVPALINAAHQELLFPDPVPPDFAFGERWSALGPFQIGTRESPWSSDPLELYGGFHSLEYNPEVIFKSSLAFNGTIKWENLTGKAYFPTPTTAEADLALDFLPSIDWPFLQEVYGWPGHQWLGWVRGEILIKSQRTRTLALNTRNIIEFWVDDNRHFGGDFYGYGKAAVTLHLSPGTHRFDVKLVGDVRSVGGIGEPTVDVSMILKSSSEGLSLPYDSDHDILVADLLGRDRSLIASPLGTVYVRNDAQSDVYVDRIEGQGGHCQFDLLKEAPVRLLPGQTRPIVFRLECESRYNETITANIQYLVDGESEERCLSVSTSPKVHKGKHLTHKITYLHPSGVVSYAILRPPSKNASCGCSSNQPLPVILGLHGANVNADDHNVMHSLDPLPDLCAWWIVPQGTTPWSGDDWHNWGFADAEAAIAAIPDWIEHVGWDGPGVDVKRWLVSGHSNGGQGVYYALTHRPDNIFAAAGLSGYSSIENYVPYTSWRTADPGKTALVHASLSSYRHDLLMENTKGIPIILQHGSKDDNVPAYHSRLMDMRIDEIGGDGTYFEVPDARHTWDGVATTKPLRDFYNRYLSCNESEKATIPINLRSFSVVVADPGDMGSKNGVKINLLQYTGQLGRIDFAYDPIAEGCIFSASNILDFSISPDFDNCDWILVDGQDFTPASSSTRARRFWRNPDGWKVWDNSTKATSRFPSLPERQGRQLGAMDSILRTRGTFQIVRHSKGIDSIALQVSRNFAQYFAADTEITDDYEAALQAKGNVISMSVGRDMPDGAGGEYEYPITVGDAVHVKEGPYYYYYRDKGPGIAAIFLRPLPNERLHLVVWGVDKPSLEVAARLVPMMTGSGQPDWVVTDRSMMWKGLQGTLALGFFDFDWGVSRNSYFS